MFDSPEPLPDDAVVGGFVPDPTLAWVIAYAGPCGEADCKVDGIPGGHTRLYLIPMIGWLQYNVPAAFNRTAARMRPAVMSSNGTLCDYMGVGDRFKMIAVIRSTDDAVEVARKLYEEHFEGSGILVEPAAATQMQN